MKALTLMTATLTVAGGISFAQDTPSPDGARVYFVNIADGDTVPAGSPVVFGLSGMGVAPAGTERENSGHHHLLVNRPPLGQGEFGGEEFELAVPSDESHRHFGGGQTETVLDLPPGEHTLQLVLGDYLHVPHDPPVVSDVITIRVE